MYAFVRRSNRKTSPPGCACARATIGNSGCKAILPIRGDCDGVWISGMGVEYGGTNRSTGTDGKARRRWTKVSIHARFVDAGEGSSTWRVEGASIWDEGNARTGKVTECASGKCEFNACAST